MPSTYPKCPAIQASLAALAGQKANVHKALRRLKRKPGVRDGEIEEMRALFRSLEAAYRQARLDAIGL